MKEYKIWIKIKTIFKSAQKKVDVIIKKIERLQKMACDWYKTLPEEKNEKKYGRNQYQNMSVERKPKVKVYGKQCRRNLSEKDKQKKKKYRKNTKKSVNNLLK